jgi:ABC-type lipoprotein release transport system permease subunit
MVAFVLIAGMVLILLTSQIRRTKREIGLLLAVGAPPLGVAMCFVIAAGSIGVLGTVAGYLAGTLVTTTAASHVMGTALTVPEGSLPALLWFVTSVSLLAAAVPAWRTVHLDVASILREV